MAGAAVALALSAVSNPAAGAPAARAPAPGHGQVQYGIFMGLQYYGPPAAHSVYERVASAARTLAPAPVFNRTGDPADGGKIVPLCDLGDAAAAAVRAGLATLRDAGAKVLHYTHTRLANYPNGTEKHCCECCERESYVRSRVANETRRFPRDGIFVDNAIANKEWLPYYAAIAGE
eukprot:gene1304-18102_t